MNKLIYLAFTAVFLWSSVAAQSTRDSIRIVGSTIVHPLAVSVGEQFSTTTGLPPPEVESTSSHDGLRLFCAGVGLAYPDIVATSRRIRPAEFESCKANGVNNMIEVKIGLSGLVLVGTQQREPLKLTPMVLYRALAKRLPSEDDDKLITNPYQTWQEVNPMLPGEPIAFVGLPTNSGTLDIFRDIVMGPSCENSDLCSGVERSVLFRLSRPVTPFAMMELILVMRRTSNEAEADASKIIRRVDYRRFWLLVRSKRPITSYAD
ncbi:MAG: substrate-binding domain-containing protein [Candidatus Competibacteraceae bacterium]